MLARFVQCAENTEIYLAYGDALFRNAQASIDALGATIAAAGAQNLEVGLLDFVGVNV